MTPLPPGKLPHHLLRNLISGIERDESVIVGPGIGRDAAAVRVGDQVLVLKTDPITFATSEIGRYLVNVNANDIACMGAVPRWLLITALLPERLTTPELVESIFGDIQQACREIGCTVVGGHTEITEGLDRPILVGNMIGIAEESQLIDPSRAEAGNAVLLIGGIAIEGTSIISTEMADELRSKLDVDMLERAQGFLHNPGISVSGYAQHLRAAIGNEIRVLHDPTEGGLATALYELAEATGLGIEIDGELDIVYPETAAICDVLNLDPMGLIASGALLAVIPSELVVAVHNAFADQDVPVHVLGSMTGNPAQRSVITRNGIRDIPTFEVDEIARLFGG